MRRYTEGLPPLIVAGQNICIDGLVHYSGDGGGNKNKKEKKRGSRDKVTITQTDPGEDIFDVVTTDYVEGDSAWTEARLRASKSIEFG